MNRALIQQATGGNGVLHGMVGIVFVMRGDGMVLINRGCICQVPSSVDSMDILGLCTCRIQPQFMTESYELCELCPNNVTEKKGKACRLRRERLESFASS